MCKQTTFVFNSVLKPMKGLISDRKVISAETEVQNIFSLTHMVSDFISRSTPPNVLSNVSVLKIFHKIYLKTSVLELIFQIAAD